MSGGGEIYGISSLAGSPRNFLNDEVGTIAQYIHDPEHPMTRYIIVVPPPPKAKAEAMVQLPIAEMPEDFQEVVKGKEGEPMSDFVAFATWRRR